jgi:outer membrane lipoprotein-sorting protein
MRCFTAIAALALLASPAHAEGLTAQQIVEKMTDRNQMGFDSGTAQVRMVLQSKSGDIRERKILSRSADVDGKSRNMIRFLAPADVQGSAFLLLEQDGDDDMYLYLPALKRTRRIAGSSKKGSFFGSDFTYADMESRDVKEADYEKLTDETVKGQDCYRVVARPRNNDQYARIELWVRKSDFLPQQMKFYDTKDKFKKAFTLHEAREIEGQMVATKSQMWTKKNGHSTFVYVERLDTRTPVNPAELTPENLKKD